MAQYKLLSRWYLDKDLIKGHPQIYQPVADSFPVDVHIRAVVFNCGVVQEAPHHTCLVRLCYRLAIIVTVTTGLAIQIRP